MRYRLANSKKNLILFLKEAKPDKRLKSILSVLIILLLSVVLTFTYELKQKSKNVETMSVSKPSVSLTPDETGNGEEKSFSARKIVLDVQPMSQWQVRTINHWGISISFPSNWYYYPTSGAEGEVQIANFDVEGFPEPEYDTANELKIIVYREPTKLTLQEYVASRKEGKVLDQQNTLVDGTEAILQERQGYGVSRRRYVYKNGYIYILAYSKDAINFTNTAEDILSTFKFLE